MKFKKNIYQDLDIIDFKDIDEFIDYFMSSYESLGDDRVNQNNSSVVLYAKSEFIWEALKKVIKIGDFDIGAMSFRRDYFDDNEDVFGLRIFDDKMLVVEEAYNNEGMPYITEGTIFLNENDCEQDLIDRALEDGYDVTLFGFNAEEKDSHKTKKSDKTSCLTKGDHVDIIFDDDEPHGFYATHKDKYSESSIYYYSGKKMSHQQINEILELYGTD